MILLKLHIFTLMFKFQVEIDMDEISDLMEEARRLGVSYGRSRTNMLQDSYRRIIPRTRHTERVRAIIRRY